jgi:NhaP-type Na+/H+ or K+/H+ antiporter
VRLRRRGIDPETRETFQPRLWLTLVGLGLIVVYLIAFVAKNDARVEVHFVLFSVTTSVIWLILLGLAIGLVAGVLLSQLERRRGWLARRRQESG